MSLLQRIKTYLTPPKTSPSPATPLIQDMSSPLRAYGNKRKRNASPASPSLNMSKKFRASLDANADDMNEYDGTESTQAVDQQEVLTRGMGRLGVRGATTAAIGDVEMNGSGESSGSPAGAVEGGEGGSGVGEDGVVAGDSGVGGEVCGGTAAQGTGDRLSRYSGGGVSGGSWPGLWSELPYDGDGEQSGDGGDDGDEKSSEEEDEDSETAEDDANDGRYAGSDGDSWPSDDEDGRLGGFEDYEDDVENGQDGEYDGDEYDDDDNSSTGDYYSDSAVHLPTQDSLELTQDDVNNDADFENDGSGSSEFTSFLSDDVVPLDEWVHKNRGKHLCKIVDAKSLCDRKISTLELQQAGHSDAHIKLVHSLQDRGFEALIPGSWQRDFTWLPDVLFSKDGNDERLMVRSLKQWQIAGMHTLRRLLEMGIDMRGLAAKIEDGETCRTPEMKAKYYVNVLETYTHRDAEMNTPRADEVFPGLLATVVKKMHTPAEELEAAALVSMEKIHAKYRYNFRITDLNTDTAQHQYVLPLPTIYALVLCHTHIGLVVYRPHAIIDPKAPVNGSAEMVAMFDFASADHDVWNVLALFIVLCHLRNERLAMKLATGWVDDSPPEEDPDA